MKKIIDYKGEKLELDIWEGSTIPSDGENCPECGALLWEADGLLYCAKDEDANGNFGCGNWQESVKCGDCEEDKHYLNDGNGLRCLNPECEQAQAYFDSLVD